MQYVLSYLIGTQNAYLCYDGANEEGLFSYMDFSLDD